MTGAMSIEPIGRVRRNVDGRAEIEVFPEYGEGLYRIEKMERILVLFLFDRSGTVDLQVHPHGDPHNPLVGVFASRSPNRPNHLGATVVHLVKVEDNVLTVEGLDAWDGTPVVDIKPDIQGWGPTCPADRQHQGKD
jgi:tRNA (adenine37-N6)-methyltransferase